MDQSPTPGWNDTGNRSIGGASACQIEKGAGGHESDTAGSRVNHFYEALCCALGKEFSPIREWDNLYKSDIL